MSPATEALPAAVRGAALRLYEFLRSRYWDGRALGGPDQGVRWHLRVGRFAKSYLPLLERGERFVFRQGQGYWALACWRLEALDAGTGAGALALAAAEECLAAQLPDGSWPYPLRERRHLKATVEGDFAALTLLRAYEHTREPRYRAGAEAWHGFLESRIGYEPNPGGGLAVNYFDKPRGLVPNNSAEVVWLLGEYARILDDTSYLGRVPALLEFLDRVQLATGEFPYELPSRHDSRHQPHYLCFQYNAFQALKLWWYFETHGDARALRLARKCTSFLEAGVLPSGASRAACGRDRPEVLYYADVLALALEVGAAHGVDGAFPLSERALRWVLSRQLPSGGFRFSRGDYGVLSDRRFYPRNLAMTLYHLLEWASRREAAEHPS